MSVKQLRVVIVLVLVALWAIAGYLYMSTAHAQAMLAPVQAYTTPDGTLATPQGRYAIQWGFNCQDIQLGANVELWPLQGIPSQVVLAPLDDSGIVATTRATEAGAESLMCSAGLTLLDAPPCSTSEGVCDINHDALVGGPAIDR